MRDAITEEFFRGVMFFRVDVWSHDVVSLASTKFHVSTEIIDEIQFEIHYHFMNLIWVVVSVVFDSCFFQEII